MNRVQHVLGNREGGASSWEPQTRNVGWNVQYCSVVKRLCAAAQAHQLAQKMLRAEPHYTVDSVAERMDALARPA